MTGVSPRSPAGSLCSVSAPRAFVQEARPRSAVQPDCHAQHSISSPMQCFCPVSNSPLPGAGPLCSWQPSNLRPPGRVRRINAGPAVEGNDHGVFCHTLASSCIAKVWVAEIEGTSRRRREGLRASQGFLACVLKRGCRGRSRCPPCARIVALFSDL